MLLTTCSLKTLYFGGSFFLLFFFVFTWKKIHFMIIPYKYLSQTTKIQQIRMKKSQGWIQYFLQGSGMHWTKQNMILYHPRKRKLLLIGYLQSCSKDTKSNEGGEHPLKSKKKNTFYIDYLWSRRTKLSEGRVCTPCTTCTPPLDLPLKAVIRLMNH